jgi:hypothetical protein
MSGSLSLEKNRLRLTREDLRAVWHRLRAELEVGRQAATRRLDDRSPTWTIGPPRGRSEPPRGRSDPHVNDRSLHADDRTPT